MPDANTNFTRWATLELGGCDGGNLSAPLWICGLEWGGEMLSDTDIFNRKGDFFLKTGWAEEVNRQILIKKQKGECSLTPPSRWTYCRCASRFAWAFLSERPGSDWEKYYYTRELNNKKGYCGFDGGLLSLNLFPLSFPNFEHKQWSNKLEISTGFSKKCEYREWCEIHRFQALQELMKRNSPVILVCAGNDEKYRSYYLKAFGEHGVKTPCPVTRHMFMNTKRKQPGYEVCTFNTVVLGCTGYIIPFFGRGQLQGYKDIDCLAGKIRKDLTESGRTRLEGYWP